MRHLLREWGFPLIFAVVVIGIIGRGVENIAILIKGQ